MDREEYKVFKKVKESSLLAGKDFQELLKIPLKIEPKNKIKITESLSCMAWQDFLIKCKVMDLTSAC